MLQDFIFWIYFVYFEILKHKSKCYPVIERKWFLFIQKKNFQTLENQIRILKAKGLVIQNPSVAKKWLSQCNYYNLINGYKELFLDYKRINEDPHHHEVFKPNTTIEELKALYDFDRELRILTLKYLFIIERKFKSNLAYYFEQFHKSPNVYLYAESYNQYKIKEINKVLFCASHRIKKISFRRWISFFYQNLSKLIVNLSLQIHTIHIKKVLKKMGFPNNWKTIIYL